MNHLFLVSDDTLVPALEQHYETEAELQDILTKHPNLLSKDSSDPHKFALIEAEFTISSDEGSTFALDHLMVNDKGVLCLVEVKRSTDTRARREVVAQMLDYASRIASVDVGSLRDLFTLNNHDFCTLELFGTDAFWERVSMNLKAERVDLYFVADSNHKSLLTILGFLGRQFSNIGVFAVEVKQFQSGSSALLTSSVQSFNQNEKIKVATPSFLWDASSFSEKLLDIERGRLEPVVFHLMELWRQEGYSIVYGKGGKIPTFRVLFGDVTIFRVELSGLEKRPACVLEINLPNVRSLLSHKTEEELRSFLSGFPACSVTEEFLRHTKQYIYVNLLLLEEKSNQVYFHQISKQLMYQLEEQV